MRIDLYGSLLLLAIMVWMVTAMTRRHRALKRAAARHLVNTAAVIEDLTAAEDSRRETAEAAIAELEGGLTGLVSQRLRLLTARLDTAEALDAADRARLMAELTDAQGYFASDDPNTAVIQYLASRVRDLPALSD